MIYSALGGVMSVKILSVFGCGVVLALCVWLYRADFQTDKVQEGKSVMTNNTDSGQKFLENNRSQPGVQVSESGLQYKIITPGGKKPQATDRVQVHYQGVLVDGTEFDSSYKRGEPASFPLRGVIAGWTEGLQYVGVGGKIKLFIPPELAYGSRAVGSIPPNSVLIFDVELLAVE